MYKVIEERTERKTKDHRTGEQIIEYILVTKVVPETNKKYYNSGWEWNTIDWISWYLGKCETKQEKIEVCEWYFRRKIRK